MRSTKTEFIGHKHYCSFCGKEAKYEYDYDEYDKIEYYFCDCEGSKIWIQIEDLQYKLKDLTDGDKLNKLRFEEEIRQLKYRYGIK